VSTCEFLKFNIVASDKNINYGSSSYETVDRTAPFSGTNTKGWVGIFGYQLLEHHGDDEIDNTPLEEKTPSMDGCDWYDGQFLDAPNEAIITSQLCATIAPSLATIAMVITTIEFCCCFLFSGSFVTTSILLLSAAGVQGGTFAIFAEPTFCYDNNGCAVGLAGIYSACASFSFFVACLLLCCSPRPYPCLISNSKNNSISNHTNQKVEEDAGQGCGAEGGEDLQQVETTESGPTITATCNST
jgi:hypothetical protein